MTYALTRIWEDALRQRGTQVPNPKSDLEHNTLDAAEYEKVIFDAVEKDMPELWRTCYPRIYTEPKCGQYYSSKKPARQLASIAMKIRQGIVGRAEMYEFQLASHLTKFGVPMYWLGADMAEAIKKTTPPGEFNWFTMPMPFEAGVFMMPKGALVHKRDGDVPFVCYARFQPLAQYTAPLVPGKPYGSINGGMVLAAGVTNRYFLHWNIPLDSFGPKVTMAQLQELMKQYCDDTHESALPLLGGGMNPDDDALGLEVAHYVFSTLMLMTARPDLITPAKMINRVPAKKGREPKEFWHPHVIGEHYKLRRQHSEPQGGTHASPRFHWVQGFWREQPYGPRDEKKRYAKWIEPFTRGGADETK